MDNKNHLIYFLNSLKEELDFKDEEDFKNKIKVNFEFCFKIQKFVFLSKYFGWNNSYYYTRHIWGPYCPELTNDYYSNDLFDYTPLKIENFQLNSFIEFIKDKSKDYLEATSTILLYKIKSNCTVEDAVNKLSDIKPHLSSQLVRSAFIDVKDFKLTENHVSNNVREIFLNDIKNNLNNKIMKNMKLFNYFEVNYNRVLILGSLDYLRIVLREENLNNSFKKDLFDLISLYINDVEKIYSICNKDNSIFENMNLNTLEEFFDRLQNYVSQELNVLPRLDDDDFDDSLFYY